MQNESTNICLLCNTKFDITDAEFCPECGQPLHNYCTNADCELNDEVQFGQIFEVPFFSKYCYKCGEKTTLYDLLISLGNQIDDHISDNS